MGKYGNRKVVIDDITFHSKMEADYYIYLKELKKDKKIKGFELQPAYLLQDAFKYKNKTIRAITYIADFKVKYLNGDIEIIDIKGFKTNDFKLKEKMLKYLIANLEHITFKCLKKHKGIWVEV